jgi:hypothetical protein
MNWENDLLEVFASYIKFGIMCLAYFFAKFCVAQHKSSTKPPLIERSLKYAACIAAVGVVAFLAAGKHDDEQNLVGMDYNWSVKVFLSLVFLALLGAKSGFKTEKSNVYHTDTNDI